MKNENQNLSLQEKPSIIMNDYQFPKDRKPNKIMVAIGITARIGLILLGATITVSFFAGLIWMFN